MGWQDALYIALSICAAVFAGTKIVMNHVDRQLSTVFELFILFIGKKDEAEAFFKRLAGDDEE